MTRVVWLSLHSENAIARGYWDQAMLESIFARDMWRVPDGLEWEHVELVGPDDGTLQHVTEAGAVLIVPARHHADTASVQRLVRTVRRMSWCLLILTGDEEGAFPSERFVDIPSTRLWVMTPQPRRNYGQRAHLFGTGWPPGIRAVLRDAQHDHRRPWAFMGQVTHARREDCVLMLQQRADREEGWLVESPGFTQGESQPDYWRHLHAAKVVPCPSGPCSPDSFRAFEALEAGCVPIADNALSDGSVQAFWERIFGAVPFPTVEGHWARESETIDQVLADWPQRANRVFAWWQRQKRLMAWRLHDDVREMAGRAPVPGPSGEISVLMTTSPSPKHPDTADIEETVRSIREQLPDAEIVLVFDGVRPELEHRREQYVEYVQRVLWLANTRWHNVVPLVLDEWLHQGRAARLGLDEIRTPHLLFMEHDTPLVGEIDWAGICETLTLQDLDVVRLHHETAIGEHHEHMMLDREPVQGPVPYVRTYQWSQRPHVARTGWYRRLLDLHLAPEARAMIEDTLHGVVSSAWLDYGDAGWARFKLGIYAAPEGNIQHSLHLDSRRAVLGEEESGDPKGTMFFAYPNRKAPPGAPAPGWTQ